MPMNTKQLRTFRPFLIALIFLTACAVKPGSAASFSIEQITSYPFPSDLTAAATGSRIAWIFNERGLRNIWVAEGPDYRPRRLTNYLVDDGQELSSVVLSVDGKYVVYVRGGDSDANWSEAPPNPASSPIAPKQQIWSIPFSGGEPRPLAEGGEEPKISPKSDVVAFEKDGAIWVTPVDGSLQARRLFSARGNSVSAEWSPDGSHLAFVSRRGDHSFIGIFTDDSSPILYLAPSTSRDSSPRWSPDGKRIAFVRRPGAGGAPEPAIERSPNPWAIWTADATSGEGRLLWKSPDTLRGSVPTTRGGTNLFWAAHGRIVFLSYMDGYAHLYSVDQSGGKPLLLTPGNYMAEFIRLSPDGGYLLFAGNIGKDGGDIDRRHLVRVPVDKTTPVVLTPGDGLEWLPMATGDGRNIALIAATAQRPPLPAVIPAEGGSMRLLAENLIPTDFPAAQLVTPEAVVFRAPDGVEIHAQLFGQESGVGKKPAIIYVHGGPQRQMLLGWNYSDYYSNAYALNQYLASKGYVVMSVNYRLGIGYGYELHNPSDAGSRGASEYQDVRAAAEYLSKLPQVDPKHIGIYGGSYGGFLTAMALARNSDIFAAGVDLNGIHDWTSDHTQAHWLLDRDSYETPPDLAQALETAWRSSPAYYINTWKSPVLLIHGDDDRNVRFSQTVDLGERLRKAGVPFEELVFPDETHAFMRHASWVKTNATIITFFDNILKSNGGVQLISEGSARH